MKSVVEEKTPPGMASRKDAYWQAGGTAGAASNGSGSACAFADATASTVNSKASGIRLRVIAGEVVIRLGSEI